MEAEISNYYSLHMFTRILIERAQKLVREGRRDDAADIARFIRNARIVQILKPYSGGPLKIDAAHLDWRLRELERECAGLIVVQQAVGDAEGLHRKLDMIAAGIGRLLATQKPAQIQTEPGIAA